MDAIDYSRYSETFFQGKGQGERLAAVENRIGEKSCTNQRGVSSGELSGREGIKYEADPGFGENKVSSLALLSRILSWGVGEGVEGFVGTGGTSADRLGSRSLT